MKFLVFVFLLLSPLLLAQSPTPQTCTEDGCYCYNIASFFAACLVGEDDFTCPYEACFAKKPTKADWEDWQEKNKEKYPNCPCLLIPAEYFEENFDPPELEIRPCSLAQQSPDYYENAKCGGTQESAVCVNGKIERRVSCADSNDYCSSVFGENSICVQKKIIVATGQKDWWNPWDKPDPEVIDACYQCRTIDSCKWEKTGVDPNGRDKYDCTGKCRDGSLSCSTFVEGGTISCDCRAPVTATATSRPLYPIQPSPVDYGISVLGLIFGVSMILFALVARKK